MLTIDKVAPILLGDNGCPHGNSETMAALNVRKALCKIYVDALLTLLSKDLAREFSKLQKLCMEADGIRDNLNGP